MPLGCGRTQGSRKCSENEPVRVLEEAKPSQACRRPLFSESAGVQQTVNITVAVRLRLQEEAVAWLQR